MVSDHLFGAGTMQQCEGDVVVIFTVLKSTVLQEKIPILNWHNCSVPDFK
jgi:hypothetical protein